MRLGVLLSALLICSQAHAGKNDPIWNPPARFDFPYKGELTVKRLPQDQVFDACRVLFKLYDVRAAAYLNQRGCSIITSSNSCLVVTVDKPFKGATPESVLRHEIGHCNGWPADHPE
jgi:hypothetical protein